jgi:hypothetical protein
MTGDHERELAERFFERQREEILGRVRTYETRRRVRRTMLPVAAVLLAGSLVAGVLLSRAPPVPGADTDWLFAWNLPAESGNTDPLGPYAPAADASDTDADETAAAQSAPALAGIFANTEAAVGETDLLPPLPAHLQDTADGDVTNFESPGRG